VTDVEHEAIALQFGENLRRCRMKAGFSQEETAHRANLHRTEIGLLERGERLPRIDTLIRLSGALFVGPSKLLEGLEWEAAPERPRGRLKTWPKGD